jgi:hypothetical protein
MTACNILSDDRVFENFITIGVLVAMFILMLASEYFEHKKRNRKDDE